MNKIVVNNCYGGFVPSKAAKDLYLELSGVELCSYNTPRHDKILVHVVQRLGEEASGFCSDLQIEEIEENRYIIEEYDGMESITVAVDWVYIEEERLLDGTSFGITF